MRKRQIVAGRAHRVPRQTDGSFSGSQHPTLLALILVAVVLVGSKIASAQLKR
jgi:hypothetical protein